MKFIEVRNCSKVYKNETVNLYFCETRYLETSQVLTVEYPDISKDTCDVRIECSTVGSDALANILYNKRKVKREDFPLTVDVPFTYDEAPVRVTIYIDGKVYQEIVMYA